VDDLYHYDSRHRLDSITHQSCAVTPGTDICTGTITPTGYTAYGYDDNDNRTAVTESSTAGVGSATTRTYCYNALNRLTAEKLTTACTSAPDETYVYDDAGNRTSATVSGSTRTFTYGTDGQLDSCSSPSCTVSYDASGRSATVTDNGVSWTFAYDADGRLISACKSTACSGSIDRVDYLYDGSGHRIQIKETTSAGAVSTTDVVHQGDTVVQDLLTDATHPPKTLVRTYATDDTGRIVEVCDPDCATGTVYVVVYNGHGDATALWKQEASGALTLANSYTYSTWGTPTITVNTGAGFSDLKFRYLYVGASDVQWDASFGLNLHYMHARHYSPVLGRFIQPDPSGAEANLYGYAAENPITRVDPTGQFCWVPIVGWIACGTAVVIYGATVLLGGATVHYYYEWHRYYFERPRPVGQPYKPYVRPVGDSYLLTKNKHLREVIRGLDRQIREHERKLLEDPFSPDAPHWRREIKTWLERKERLEDRLPGR
jgi:RHS repeat-associated protein